MKGPAQPRLCSSVCTNVFLLILLVGFSYSFCCSETNVLPSVLSSGRCAEADKHSTSGLRDNLNQSRLEEP